MTTEYTSPDGMLVIPDFSEAKDFTPVPAGNYVVVVDAVEGPILPKKADASTGLMEDGKKAIPMMVFSLTTTADNPEEFRGRTLKDFYCAVSGKYSGFLLGALKALDPSYKKGDTINKLALVGRKAVAVVDLKMYVPPGEDASKGRPSNNVLRLEPFNG